jgi:hypothetical protein
MASRREATDHEAQSINRQTRLKTKLGLPDLEHAKVAVIISLRSFESQRSYRRSIEEFVAWYCSAPRLSFNKTVVLRYRLHLEESPTRCRDHKRQASCCKAASIRSCRFWIAEPRSSSGHSPCERRKEARVSTGKLVNHRARSSALAIA